MSFVLRRSLSSTQQQHQNQQQHNPLNSLEGSHNSNHTVHSEASRYSNPSNNNNDNNNTDTNMGDEMDKGHGNTTSKWQCMSSIRLTVLLVLCFQNSLFTLTRRYSQGILQEEYSKYECLLVGEVIKMAFSAYMIQGSIQSSSEASSMSVWNRLQYLVSTSRKMMVLAVIYGVMNILSFVALRNIGAGMFTIFAQMKILTTASFSSLMLNRTYSWTKWRALLTLMCGVLLFSHPIWQGSSSTMSSDDSIYAPLLGICAVTAEVCLSGFASIYFEKAIKTDPLKLSIWERNFQLALGSFPVYVGFIIWDQAAHPDTAGLGQGWSPMAWIVALLGAVGGLLVALSIKYGDSILKTLATTGAIVLSSILDHFLLGGPLTPIMALAGIQVIVAICDYAFDQTAVVAPPPETAGTKLDPTKQESGDEEVALIARSPRN